MKKLALVTLLAVAASWLLLRGRRAAAGPRRPPARVSGPAHESSTGSPARPAPTPPEPPSPPEAIQHRPLAQGRRTGRSGRPAPAATAEPRPAPSWFPKSEVEEEAKARPDASGIRVLVGRLSASEDRARQDLRKTLEREVSDWIAADVPPSWKVPAPLIDRMVRGTYVQKVTRSLKPTAGEPRPWPRGRAASTAGLPGLDDLYTLYRAGQQLDFSPGRRARDRRDLPPGPRHPADAAARRGPGPGPGLLAVMTGYIRADEATQGYYTNRLRLAAAAGLGAAGVAAYRFLA